MRQWIRHLLGPWSCWVTAAAQTPQPFPRGTPQSPAPARRRRRHVLPSRPRRLRPRRSTACGASRSSDALRSQSRLPDLSRGAVHRVVRRRPRAALLHLWFDGGLCRPRHLLPDASERQRQPRVPGAADAHVRGRQVQQRDDGVSPWRDDQGLHVGRLAGLREPEAGAQPARFPSVLMIVPAPPGTPR